MDIRKKLRKVKKKCKVCKVKPRYLDFKRCLDCQHKKVTQGVVKPKPEVVVGQCKRCGKKAELRDYVLRASEDRTQYAPPKKLWCFDCCILKLYLLGKKLGKEAEAEQRRLQAVFEAERAAGMGARMSKKAQAKLNFKKIKKMRSLAAEGNIPLMRRLLREDKNDDEILKIFTDLYKTQGKTNEKWIKSRVQTYKRIIEEKDE